MQVVNCVTMQLRMIADLGLYLEVGGKVTYEQVETALHEQAIFSGYRLDMTPLVDTTKIYVSVGVPVETITAEGVPELPAVQLLRSLADALDALEQRLAE